MKKKILKIQVGQAYDKDTKKSLPVYATAWKNKDGSYTITQRVFVQEIEVKGSEESSDSVDA